MIPLGFDEQYQRYLELYAAFKKPLNKRDMEDGHVIWIPMKVEDRRAAFINLRQRFLDTKDVTKVPFPRMHLFARSWERQIIETAPKTRPAEAIACQDCLDAGFLGSDVDAPCDCAAGVRWREQWGLNSEAVS